MYEHKFHVMPKGQSAVPCILAIPWMKTHRVFIDLEDNVAVFKKQQFVEKFLTSDEHANLWRKDIQSSPPTLHKYPEFSWKPKFYQKSGTRHVWTHVDDIAKAQFHQTSKYHVWVPKNNLIPQPEKPLAPSSLKRRTPNIHHVSNHDRKGRYGNPFFPSPLHIQVRCGGLNNR